MTRFVLLFALQLACLISVPLHAGEEQPAPVTAILGAMEVEISILTKALTEPAEQSVQQLKFTRGMLGGRRVVIARTGVGKVNAAIVATLLLEHFKPSEVLFTGIAGSLNPNMHPGDIVIAEKTAQHDFGDFTAQGLQSKGTRSPVTWKRNPLFFEADKRLLALAHVSAGRLKLQALPTSEGERTPKILRGVVVTGDVFVADGGKKGELHKTFSADAVEMEGAAVAQVCYQQNVPCLVIRCMSDVADANALKDARSFGPAAAENSARLIQDLVAQLGDEAGKKP
ncbi:MAG: 5'-methylthioadenosine/adenosylhomocysteine nucleosidase [Planctomycetota bacterium]|nr:5'-methylthioadenosine/adenosylhomocysteine nucleosidase [Planctomycetota bacterium]